MKEDEDVVMDGHVLNGDHPMDGAPNGFDDAGSQNGDSEDEKVVYFEEKDNLFGYPETWRKRGQLSTGCCFDVRMQLHANADFGPQPHPEDPRRVASIMATFKKAGLVYTGSDADLIEILQTCPTRYMWRIPAREATKEEICKVHTPMHFNWVEALSEKSTGELRSMTKTLDQGRKSLYVGSMSYEAALLSAGGAIETCKSVVAGTVKNAFAVIRPPGHHAEYNEALGFCLFNNVPIAARCVQDAFPDTCRKILILDWDVHHGNGIQNMFYDDPNVLYISLHVFMKGTFYPGEPENSFIPNGDLDKCGNGKGLGKNVNIGWDTQGMGDGEYMAAFQKIVMPIGHEFNPDLVIISAGFDAAAGDELGACFVTPTCYAHMTHMLMSLAQGKVAVCLEGGYNLQAISNSALAVARTLMGEAPPQMKMPKIDKGAAQVLARVQAYQAPYWECMRPGVVDPVDAPSENTMRIHDVTRGYQRLILSEKYGMVPLYLQRENLFKSFENEVLVTKNYMTARQVLVIIHDPPHLIGQPNLVTNKMEPHNAWVADGTNRYIDWAIKRDFGVVDINIPHYLSPHGEDTNGYADKASERDFSEQMRELMVYLWDNYLQLSDSQIFLMGVGDAYLGIKMLLINREVKDRVAGVVGFVDGYLRPVKSDVDHDLSSWYKEHSRVYVINTHLCWQDPDTNRKVNKRRFGTIKRSPETTVPMMMKVHAEDVQSWIMELVEEDPDETAEE